MALRNKGRAGGGGGGGTPETSESIKQKLESLMGEDRLDLSALKTDKTTRTFSEGQQTIDQTDWPVATGTNNIIIIPSDTVETYGTNTNQDSLYDKNDHTSPAELSLRVNGEDIPFIIASGASSSWSNTTILFRASDISKLPVNLTVVVNGTDELIGGAGSYATVTTVAINGEAMVAVDTFSTTIASLTSLDFTGNNVEFGAVTEQTEALGGGDALVFLLEQLQGDLRLDSTSIQDNSLESQLKSNHLSYNARDFDSGNTAKFGFNYTGTNTLGDRATFPESVKSLIYYERATTSSSQRGHIFVGVEEEAGSNSLSEVYYAGGDRNLIKTTTRTSGVNFYRTQNPFLFDPHGVEADTDYNIEVNLRLSDGRWIFNKTGNVLDPANTVPKAIPDKPIKIVDDTDIHESSSLAIAADFLAGGESALDKASEDDILGIKIITHDVQELDSVLYKEMPVYVFRQLAQQTLDQLSGTAVTLTSLTAFLSFKIIGEDNKSSSDNIFLARGTGNKIIVASPDTSNAAIERVVVWIYKED